MTEQDLFQLLALQRVRRWRHYGKETADALVWLCRGGFKTAQLAAIDGVGSILLRSLKDKSVLRKQVVS
jgi:DNA processing protein